MSRLKRIARGAAKPSSSSLVDLLSSADVAENGATDDSAHLIASSVVVSDTGIRIDSTDPANVQRPKTHNGWWLPDDVSSWWEIPEPEAGEPTKEKPLTVQQLMRQEREFHLYGRGAGGKHVPDQSPRLLALVIDVLVDIAVVFAYKALVGYPLVGAPLRPAPALVGIIAAVHLFPVVMWRASIGKLVFGLRVVRVNGAECSVIRAFLRVLIPPLAIVDAVFVLLTPHRRRLIDYVLGTRVVSNG